MKKTFLGTTLLVILAALAACGNTTTEPTVGPVTEYPDSTQTTVPSTTAPQTTVPSTTAPQTTVPSTTVPQTTAPSTTAPQTTVPSTTVPPTTVPPTTVPPTTVPPTTVPPTTVPPTTVPPTSEVPVVDEIKGKIVDQNGESVKDVKVYLTYQTMFIALEQSGEDGTFTFTKIEEGTYNVILVPPSDSYEYKGKKITIEYTGGTYDLADIVLTKLDMNWGALS